MRRLFPLAALAAGIVLVGCEDRPSKPAGGSSTTTAETTKVSRKHDAWWCSEHGIPEHECLMCLHSEEDLKKKGDWCEKHDRAKSQCFKCDPKLREKYAAKYRAKYGKEPPPIEVEDEKKDDKAKVGEKK